MALSPQAGSGGSGHEAAGAGRRRPCPCAGVARTGTAGDARRAGCTWRPAAPGHASAAWAGARGTPCRAARPGPRGGDRAVRQRVVHLRRPKQRRRHPDDGGRGARRAAGPRAEGLAGGRRAGFRAHRRAAAFGVPSAGVCRGRLRQLVRPGPAHGRRACGAHGAGAGEQPARGAEGAGCCRRPPGAPAAAPLPGLAGHG